MLEGVVRINRRSLQFLGEHIVHFTTVDIGYFSKAQTSWIQDIFPLVKIVIGFI
ncbi:hypothetical protein B0O99DRAFT_616758 [Bisporella sp. PMI_857]|nr:hypothetical protein B0O99DRAFT_616758 [Bisporella sp. PMI_857]